MAARWSMTASAQVGQSRTKTWKWTPHIAVHVESPLSFGHALRSARPTLWQRL